MNTKEAKRIRACNGKGYSTVEFIQALQLTEPNPPIKKGLDTNKETKTMIAEDYISFEIAKLLKEKGFDEECQQYYGDYKYPCPTLQMAMKWLREVHKIYMYIVRDGMENTWFARVYNDYKTLADVDNHSTYEEACEAAIKYCLENLI